MIHVIEKCPKCLKVQELCICDAIRPIETRIHVLILQHPQEPDESLGSARLAHLALPNSTLKVGLSWPNLRKASGKEVESSNWAVLYLGSGVKSHEEVLAAQPILKKSGKSSAAVKKEKPTKKEDFKTSSPSRIQFVTKQGTPTDAPTRIEGLVVLDGTWSQAKALWWRNAWLLKLKRAVLQPSRPSLYRELRKEPRKECLSTIESVAEALEALGEPALTGDELRKVFSQLLDKQRTRIQNKQSEKKLKAKA